MQNRVSILFDQFCSRVNTVQASYSLQLNEFSSDVKVSPLDELQRAKGIDRTNKQLSTEIAAMDEIGESILQATYLFWSYLHRKSKKIYIEERFNGIYLDQRSISG